MSTKLFIFISGLLATHLFLPMLAMDADSTAIFVRHVTNVLPLPVMKIGGLEDRSHAASFPYRCTLHWSLLGLEPRGTAHPVFKSDAEHGLSQFVEHKGKYILLENIKHLAPYIVGGWPFDIYVVGPYEPSSDSILFLPSSELADALGHNYKGTIVSYEETTESSKCALASFLTKNATFKRVDNCLGAMRTSALERHLDYGLCQGAYESLPIFAKAKEENLTQVIEGDCSFDIAKDYGEGKLTFHCYLFDALINGDKYILFGFSGGDKYVPLKNLCCQQKSRDFDCILFLTGSGHLSFNQYLESAGVKIDQLYFDHNSSDFYELEMLSGKLQRLSQTKTDPEFLEAKTEIHALLARIQGKLGSEEARSNFSKFSLCVREFW